MQHLVNYTHKHLVEKCGMTHALQDLLPVLDVRGWKPFLEREDLLVWRKEDEVFHGLYVYKGVYYLLRYLELQKNCSEIS
jgi:hypothetical protein